MVCLQVPSGFLNVFLVLTAVLTSFSDSVADDIESFCNRQRNVSEIRAYLQSESLHEFRMMRAPRAERNARLSAREAGELRCELNSCTFRVEEPGLLNGLGELAGPIIRKINNFKERLGSAQLHSDLGYTRYEGGDKIEFGATPQYPEVLCLIGTLLKQANYEIIEERRDPLILNLYIYYFTESGFTDLMLDLQGILQIGSRALTLDAGLASLTPGSLQGVVANKNVYTIGSQLQASTGSGRSLSLVHDEFYTTVGKGISAGDTQTLYFDIGRSLGGVKEDSKGLNFFTFINRTVDPTSYALSQCSLTLSEYTTNDLLRANAMAAATNENATAVVEGVRRLNPMSCSGRKLKLGQPLVLLDRGFSTYQESFSLGLTTGRRRREEQGRLLVFATLYRESERASLLSEAVTLNSDRNQQRAPIQSLNPNGGIFLTAPRDRAGK